MRNYTVEIHIRVDVQAEDGDEAEERALAEYDPADLEAEVVHVGPELKAKE